MANPASTVSRQASSGAQHTLQPGSAAQPEQIVPVAHLQGSLQGCR